MFLFPARNNFLFNKQKDLCATHDLLLDEDYCLIYVLNNDIVCSYFFTTASQSSYLCQINFSAASSDHLLDLICRHKKLTQFISLSHAFYIAQEAYKAQLSKALSQFYIQS